jgi:sodium/bile acid cotransporter 7
MLRRLGIDPFLIGLLAVVGLAIAWPAPGRSGGFLHMDDAATYGIGIVFLLYGLNLAPGRLLAGLTQWRVHIVVQVGTFVLFPLLVLAVFQLLPASVPTGVLLGFFFLAALPSTVSSSVAMTSLAGGNVAIAIFNATLSSLLGVVITPVLMAWYLESSGAPLPLLPVIGKILLVIVAPIVVGQVLRRWLSAWAGRHTKALRIADRAVILAIVYNSFCDSVSAGLWSGQDPLLLVLLIVSVILLFIIAGLIMLGACRLMGFDRGATIAATFCGSKKSLATGIPLAKVMFGAGPALGYAVTPVMLYHFFQLVVVGFIAARLVKTPQTVA